MSTLEELVAVGEKLQLTGKDPRAFIATQQEAQREERRQNREAEKLEAERERQAAETARERERQEAETTRERERQEAETTRERERQEAETTRERERQEAETTRERERRRYEQKALEAAHRREIELLEVRSRLKVQDGGKENQEEGDEEGRRFNRTKATPAKLDVPKFDNKQIRTVAKYFDLFEGVVKQNGYEKEVWPLALRTAVAPGWNQVRNHRGNRWFI